MVGGASLCAHYSSYGQAEIVEFMLLVNNCITIVLTRMEMRERGSDLLSHKTFFALCRIVVEPVDLWRPDSS